MKKQLSLPCFIKLGVVQGLLKKLEAKKRRCDAINLTGG
jgi:hypothetical protein